MIRDQRREPGRLLRPGQGGGGVVSVDTRREILDDLLGRCKEAEAEGLMVSPLPISTLSISHRRRFPTLPRRPGARRSAPPAVVPARLLRAGAGWEPMARFVVEQQQQQQQQGGAEGLDAGGWRTGTRASRYLLGEAGAGAGDRARPNSALGFFPARVLSGPVPSLRLQALIVAGQRREELVSHAWTPRSVGSRRRTRRHLKP
ncbi:hypothetical protein F4809DRAFT_644259 [Biscogniauxia mediterranea]|nr:hypothetical protein F4809DRAFT_644259 [Biscogniauxia mediterranea]